MGKLVGAFIAGRRGDKLRSLLVDILNFIEPYKRIAEQAVRTESQEKGADA